MIMHMSMSEKHFNEKALYVISIFIQIGDWGLKWQDEMLKDWSERNCFIVVVINESVLLKYSNIYSSIKN